ncbi:MAG TPA: asparaginase domain-containing protein [Gammaproteobacteria bacterium]|nr:asparaginase domain-containing protein [Gammaproteobacteria bacterium]
MKNFQPTRREHALVIKIFTTGGTFDKVYFDAASEFHFGESIVGALLEEANVSFDFDIEALMQKDSLDIVEADREFIRRAVENCVEERILIVHGTDGMIATAEHLLDISGKTVVLFGAMQPARMRYGDAMYNLGFACAAVQLLPRGIHLAMNGQVFDPRKIVKNRARNRFEQKTG